jgi:hypothetical protein
MKIARGDFFLFPVFRDFLLLAASVAMEIEWQGRLVDVVHGAYRTFDDF